MASRLFETTAASAAGKAGGVIIGQRTAWDCIRRRRVIMLVSRNQGQHELHRVEGAAGTGTRFDKQGDVVTIFDAKSGQVRAKS